MVVRAVLDRVRGLWKAVRALVRKNAVESELDDELAFHLAMEAEKNERAGLSPEAARRRARLSFRGVERYKEEVRDARMTRWLETAARDLGMALRTVRRSPGLAVVVVLTLGLGIGASTVIFSVLDAAVLQPLPWSDPDRLVLVEETTPDGRQFTVSEPNYLDFAAGATTLSELAAYRPEPGVLRRDGRPERVDGMAASHTLFTLLGARPVLGRTYGAEEDAPGGDTRVVVLSHGLWRSAFGADPDVVGRTVEISGVSRRVIGVMGEDFEFPAEFWVPLAPDPRADRMDHWLDVFGRLAPGATPAAAEAELSAISAGLASAHPAMEEWGVDVEPLAAMMIGPEFRRAGVVLAAAVGLLLLLACANAANLLLAHATSRQGDLAVRSAMGASRLRITRQLLLESLLLAMAGAGLAVVGASVVVGAIRRAAPAGIPRVENVAIDPRVLAFTVVVATVTALLAGLAPALRAGRADAADQLRDAGRHGASRDQRRLRDLLVVAQVAVAVVLLLGAGLMVRSLVRLQAVDAGFDFTDVWAAPIQLTGPRYEDSANRYFAYRDMLDAIRAVPGVTEAGGTFVEPFSGMNTANDVTPEDRAADGNEAGYLSAAWRTVTASYFETVGVPLLEGRLFTPEDRYGNAPTVIVSRTLAERLWPDRSAIGQRLYWGGTDGEPRTVVGVVGDIRDVALDADPPPVLFLSYRQLGMPAMTILVRTRGEVAGLPDAVRRAIWSVDPSVPVPEVKPLARTRAAAVAGPRFNTLVLAAFAIASMLIAAVGIYGLLAFLVRRRTREIGVRRALGATSGAVFGDILRRALVLAALGGGLGLAVTLALHRPLEAILYETAGTDPATFLAVPVLFAVITALAAWVPARRAARISPMVALRSD